MGNPAAPHSRLWTIGRSSSGRVSQADERDPSRPFTCIDRDGSRARCAASSSCSYAAVALARSVFRKGADFSTAMAFETAFTDLVLELSIIMLVFLGWQFMLAS